jgi:hypothetical protein
MKYLGIPVSKTNLYTADLIYHYVRNSNRRHGSETYPREIISDLEKRDATASLSHGIGSVEGRKETICFSVWLR